MDTAQTTTHISLCAGYGGIDLGLKRVIPNLRTVAFSEIEAYACANLVAKMEAGLLDPAPVWTDLKSFPWESFRGLVDILSGGYPCQGFSLVGKRLGAEDPRHLWPFILEGIRIMRPSLCFFENVEGHITLGLSTVLSDLEEADYSSTFGLFSAEEVGLPHRRNRVFIMAHPHGAGLEGLSRDVHTERFQLARSHRPTPEGGVLLAPARPGQPQHGWEAPRVLEPSLGRATDGSSTRVDELRLLGNGVVPAVAAHAFRTLLTRLVTSE